MTPIFITLAVCLPAIVLMVGIYLWVRRSLTFDRARFKVLRVLLCVSIGCAGISFVAALFASKPGESLSAGLLVPGVTNLVVASVIALQIQQCRRSLGGRQ